MWTGIMGTYCRRRDNPNNSALFAYNFSRLHINIALARRVANILAGQAVVVRPEQAVSPGSRRRPAVFAAPFVLLYRLSHWLRATLRYDQQPAQLQNRQEV